MSSDFNATQYWTQNKVNGQVFVNHFALNVVVAVATNVVDVVVADDNDCSNSKFKK